MGKYIRLVDFGSQTEKEKAFLSAVADKGCGYVFDCDTADFNKIPGSPIAYWLNNKMLSLFNNSLICNYAHTRNGLTTGDNERFLKLWFEIENNKIEFLCDCIENSSIINKKWFPYNKGGESRRWFGNNDFIINWESNGKQLRAFKGLVPRSLSYMFKECISWSKISANSIAFRVKEKGSMFDVAGLSLFSIDKDKLLFLIGLCNSIISNAILKAVSPTLNYEVGHIASIPVILDESKKPQIDKLVQECIDISKADWDSFETSWDFAKNPMIAVKNKTTYKTNGVESFLIEDAYWHYKNRTEADFTKLKSNEEELNRLFIDIYGLQDELVADVSEKDVTVARIFDTKAEIPEGMKGNRYVMTKTDVVKDFVSYAVGCMFGRYSPYKDGLIFAGGEFSTTQFQDICVGAKNADTNFVGKMFMPNIANIIPLTDKDYFENVIVSRFCEFLAEVYGKETLEQNLTFVAQGLGVKGNTSRDMIRNYFVNDFYADHIKKYKKRPIYWQLDSGKCGGFKALFYLHRFDESTLPTARVDNLHELQFKYNFEIERLKKDLEKQNLTTADKTAINKQINTLAEKVKETLVYDQVLNHACNLRIKLDLDDGVKTNYTKLQTLDGTTSIGLLTNIKL